ncbi:DUF402 domain-containing protein [Bacillus salacetis]|uniref:DUF402 domain-containing protein n=1 Tax=Bacillus salacetis TaxID=2315464 RepID=A0A3A1QQ55_9BACI|nr:DUF402 domain-containing protein [Bacillus salacetis]RIW29192.1 DUF402 domain-containing protein [Bacillus salacetis]
MDVLKRKYGNRQGWKRIIDSRYAQSFLKNDEFKGFITLLHTVKVAHPLMVRYAGHSFCIADDGYMWLHQFPEGKNHCVTTMYNEKGEIVQWYIDICVKNHLEDEVPWMEDLYLDLVILPTGEIIEKDVDELEEALSLGKVDRKLYDLAWKEQREILHLIKAGEFQLLEAASAHKELLIKKLFS